MKFLVSLFTYFIVVNVSYGQDIKDEIRLLKALTDNYNVDVRPVQNSQDTVNVSMGASLQQILEFDEEKQVLHILVWIRKSWKDVSLKWNTSEYGGIDMIRIPPSRFWKPDITLYNSASDRWHYSQDTLAVVASDGSVFWIPPTHILTSCFLDFTKFPFDSQSCEIKFGSWTYSGNKVNLKLMWGKEMDRQEYLANKEWDVISTPAVLNVKKYACCEETYPDITFTLNLKRSSFKYARSILAPSVILALTIPLVFLLPPGSQEKTNLGTGVLIGLILLAIMLRDMMPPGAHTVAAISLYNMSCIAMTGFSLVFASMVNTIWYKTGDVPPIIAKIFLAGIGRILCVSLNSYYKMPFEPLEVEGGTKDGETSSSARSRGEWQLLAMVFDRLLLIIFLVAVIVTTCVLMV